MIEDQHIPFLLRLLKEKVKALNPPKENFLCAIIVFSMYGLIEV
jgi:hypothetical protein